MPRYEGTDHNRASYMSDIQPGYTTLADEKLADPEHTVGSASDHAHVLDEAVRKGRRG